MTVSIKDGEKCDVRKQAGGEGSGVRVMGKQRTEGRRQIGLLM
jgi:hypothetical protein